MRRRRLLGGTAWLSPAALAGCAFTNVPEETILTAISVTNRTGERREIDLLVTRFEDVVAWETFDLEPAEEDELPLDVSDDPGDFHAYVRVDDRRASHDVSPRSDTDCITLTCVVEDDEIRFVTGPEDC